MLLQLLLVYLFTDPFILIATQDSETRGLVNPPIPC